MFSNIRSRPFLYFVYIYTPFLFSLQIVDIVRESSVMDECVSLCEEFGDKAISAINRFQSSDAKNALVNMVNATKVL